MGDYVAWLGGLPRGTKHEEVEDFVRGFGKVTDVSIRSSPKDVFAFVTFADERDGQDAVAALDQKHFLKSDNKIFMAKAGKRGGGGGGGGGGGRDGGGRRSRSPPPRRRDSRERPPPPRRSPERRRSPTPRRRSPTPRRPSPKRAPPPSDFVAWIGGLPSGVNEDDIRDFLRKYGRLLEIRLRSSSKDQFAFVTFADKRDGEDAVRDLDQTRFLSSGSSVQMRKSETGRPVKDMERYDHRRDDDRDRNRERSRGRDPPKGKTTDGYRIKLVGLPKDMDWKELKDMSRTFGDSVKFANVFRESDQTSGVIEYESKRDAERALRQYDNRRIEGVSGRLKAIRQGWD
eukprot:TRINITY_DN11901_c0_g1_i1.p1 TRINITY_DN11901_c0_g1~~TRINITY_DN11901_c0_g1_i1.p1  ORF type:complete len:371 (-),score=56.00 TRINITY_DN11901_c0_g1_i1:156-1187(-)